MREVMCFNSSFVPAFRPPIATLRCCGTHRRQEESGPYAARGPVSRGRLSRAARAAQAADARPRPGMDLTDSGRLRDRTTEEPVPASPTPWRTQPVADDRTGDSQQPPRLTFLDETPDEIQSAPPPAQPANWDEPDPYHTRVSPPAGRHSGEYQVLRRTDGYRPTWQAALEPAPAHIDHDEATFHHPSQPHAWRTDAQCAMVGSAAGL